jgi:hypothetical protein
MPRLGEEHTVSDVLIPLKPRRVTGDAAQATAELKLVPRRLEQAPGCFDFGGGRWWSSGRWSGCLRLRLRISRRFRHLARRCGRGRTLRVRQRGHGEREPRDQR